MLLAFWCAAMSDSPLGDAGGDGARLGFNRELRLAERRRSQGEDSSSTNKAKTPPAISAVVLDDVDGDVLDGSPHRVPGSPIIPSPQRLSIPRTPVSGRSLLERSLLDSGPPSVPPTPSSTTTATSVEVLFRGTMRSACSGWFYGGEAWFPAELLDIYRDPAAPRNGEHPAFENETQDTAGLDDVQIWVQVRVPAALEQPVFWVKMQAVRRVKSGGVQPTVAGEEVEVAQILDGCCIWYRGRLLAAPRDGTGAGSVAPTVQLYGFCQGIAHEVEEGQWQDGSEQGEARQARGPTIKILPADTPRRLRRPLQCLLSAEDALDMVTLHPAPPLSSRVSQVLLVVMHNGAVACTLGMVVVVVAAAAVAIMAS